MKGVILRCLQEIVENRYGKDVWEEALKKADVEDLKVLPVDNIDDSIALAIFKNLCEITGEGVQGIAEEFGRYWINVYSQRLYKTFYNESDTAMDFILKIDEIHQIMTKNIGTNPPRFKYEWKDDRTLLMKYKSRRNLIDLAVGLLKGVAEYYGEDIQIRKIDENNIEIRFG